MFNRALVLLRTLLGPEADFRRNQWEAIEALAQQRRRVLVVERTGWGKSVVYFLATKLLREAGAGPTLLISPLLTLMRTQLHLARRIGIGATIVGGNRLEWDHVEAALARDACDILLVSPERLSNERFVNSVLPAIRDRLGMLVVDEAHCISDWGHGFRPDYRRIRELIEALPAGAPVLATTATANGRVIVDVRKQLGDDLLVIRGPLARATLRLQNLSIADQAERLAWLAENLPKFAGSGIIYCLTVGDTERVAAWLRSRQITAHAYHGRLDHTERQMLEHALVDNRVKALVATVALGMGFDKPDLSFVIHFQRPGSVVAYYQQVGRAGRGADKAYGILLAGQEDDGILRHFIAHAFPRPEEARALLDKLPDTDGGLTINELLGRVNLGRSAIESALRILEFDGAVAVDASSGPPRYRRGPRPWQPDSERRNEVTRFRLQELEQMHAYVRERGCLMEFLVRALDDPEAHRCGVCANCQGRGLPPTAETALIAEAVEFLKHEELTIEPRTAWPAGLFPDGKSTILPAERLEPGRALCCYGDRGWGRYVKIEKENATAFSERLVAAAVAKVRDWGPSPFPTWVTAVPSPRRSNLAPDLAIRLAAALGLPFAAALVCAGARPEERTLNNSILQARNAKEMLAVAPELIQPGPVLLVDDVVGAGWTLTVGGWLLRGHGSGMVYPFALARVGQRGG
jgi:ATP-dependent DNA helicase RecQ